MDAHETILTEWRQNVAACIEGKDPMTDDDYCGQCNCRFEPLRTVGVPCERTKCVDCGRFFGNGGTDQNAVRLYKL